MPILLSDFYPTADAVLISGNQIISGVKTFRNETIFSIIRPDLGLAGQQNRIYLNSGIIFSANSPSINWRDRWLSGQWKFDNRPQVNGSGVLLQGEVVPGGGSVGTGTVILENVVYTTGSQSITGPKNFTARPTYLGLDLITTGDLTGLELSIDGALSSTTAFNGIRPIRQVPTVNRIYGGTTISGFLENMFFPYSQLVVTINNFITHSYGISSVGGQIYNGNISETDDSITGIAYMSGNNILLGPSSRTQTGIYTTSPTAVNFSSSLITNTDNIFKTRIFGLRSGTPFTSDSSSIRIRFEPAYFWGTSTSTGFVSSDLVFNNLSNLNRVDPTSNPNFYNYNYGSRPLTITENFQPSTNQYIYLVYPSFNAGGISDWGTVTNIRDVNTNLTYTLNTYQTGQLILNFSLQPNLRYRVYRSLLPLTPTDPLNPSTYRMEFTLGGNA